MRRVVLLLTPLALCASLAVAQSGDPVTVRASGLGTAWAVIADPYGDFIVGNKDNNQVWWVTADGRKQVITQIGHATGIGWDMFGNLLITAEFFVFKLNPKGVVMNYIVADGMQDVALAPDGTLWFTNWDSSLRHYDALGKPLERINLTLFGGQAGPFQIAISSSGDIYFTSNAAAGGTTVYRLTNRQAQRLFNLSWRVIGMAVDAAGNLFLSGGEIGNGHVAQYSPSGTPIADPFATQVSPTGIAFGRNADGSMNKRLFVVESSGRLLELNPSGVEQPGAPVGFATSAQAIADVLKPGVLTDAQRRVIDQVGNNNGRYDVGDLRAFLLQTTTISAGAAYSVR